MPLKAGTRVGPYEIVAPLGAGGMGEVYRARDPRLARDVAIKALPVEFARDPERLARFEREARLLASLSHPNIAGIHGLELVGDHRYLVLEFVEGETLAARLARGALPMDEALHVCAQVAGGIEAAHEAGVIHRDLKPGNVMLKPDGSVKVLDFGLAKGGPAGGSDPNLSTSPTMTHAATGAGVILGTAAYMSPEQARGKSVDRRTDIWSFGCVLYECLTGRQAFAGETVSDVIARILQAEPDWSALPPTTPARIVELLRRCLTREVTFRLRDVGEARIALVRAHEPGAAPSHAATRKRGLRAYLPWGIAVIAVAVAIAAIALGRGSVLKPGAEEASVVIPPGYRLGANTGYHLAALSPDGRALAYTARGAGGIGLRVRRLDGREDIGIPGTDDARDPFFSPDGEWIAFFDGKNLLKVSVHGGAPVPLARTGQDRGGVWLDDGRIVFAPEPTQPLHVIPNAGGPPVPLTTLDSTRKERSHRWPSALGGGPWVVFTVGSMDSPGNYDGADIDGVSVKTGERRHLIHGGRRAVWAPPDHLVFDRAGSLYAVKIDPRNPRVTQEPVPVLDGVAGEGSSGAAFLDIARDGTMAWLPADQNDIQREIGWFDRSGRCTPTRVPPGEYRHLALSPDGGSALVLVGSGGGAGDTWLADLVSGGTRRLTYTNSSDMSVWLPDGSSFARSTADSAGVNLVEVRRVDGAGGARTLFRNGPPILVSSVTPDGDAVLFSDFGPASGRMHLVPVSPGHAPSELPTDATDQVQEQAGVLSPDGRWLAYISNRTGREEVFIRRRDGTGGGWQVTTRGGSGVRWGRAGRELFFVEDETLKRVTVAIRGDELVVGQPETLFEVPASPIEPTYRDYAYDPMGDRFLFTRPLLGTDQRRELALSIGWGARITDLIRKRQQQR